MSTCVLIFGVEGSIHDGGPGLQGGSLEKYNDMYNCLSYRAVEKGVQPFG